MSDKKGFILPYGTAAQIGRLISLSGSEAAVKLLGALEVYSQDGTEPEGLDLAAEMLFESMRAELDRDREHYNDVVDKRKAAAAARWNNANASTCNAPDANASVCNANDADIDSRQEIEDRRQEIEVIDTVIALPLNDHTTHSVTAADVAEFAQLYPAVDVMQELRKMRGWLLNNPTRRKTKRGIKAFINLWLSKEQDRARAAPTPENVKRRLTATDIMSLPEVEVHL